MNLTIEHVVHFGRSRKRKTIQKGAAPTTNTHAGRVPRISRLMALALRMERLLANGDVRDYAELARLGQVSRARVSQIMGLLNLAPDLQQALLYLPLTEHGRDSIREHRVRPIAGTLDWNKQRRMWRALMQLP